MTEALFVKLFSKGPSKAAADSMRGSPISLSREGDTRDAGQVTEDNNHVYRIN